MYLNVFAACAACSTLPDPQLDFRGHFVAWRGGQGGKGRTKGEGRGRNEEKGRGWKEKARKGGLDFCSLTKITAGDWAKPP